MNKNEFKDVVAKVAAGLRLTEEEAEQVRQSRRLEYFCAIPFHLGVPRATEYAVRNLALLIGDDRADWFPGTGYGADNVLDRFLPLMMYPGISREKVEPLFYGPTVGMLNCWLFTAAEDRAKGVPNLANEGTDLEALRDSFLKMASEDTSSEIPGFSTDLWNVRGVWIY